MERHFGLIGFPLGHSFSQNYFQKKFKEQGLNDHSYNLFELSSIDGFPDLIKSKKLAGVNVTIPYKQAVIPFLNKLDSSAEKVGAVNVIKNENGDLIGYNSDYPAFRKSLQSWLSDTKCKALVLGTGGASKAVIAALNDLDISFQQVSRNESESIITYKQLLKTPSILETHKLIVNTTPLGMAPSLDTFPELPYQYLTSSNLLFDLVYNPEETTFLKKGKAAGCQIKNGLEMLYLQADLAWDIWNS